MRCPKCGGLIYHDRYMDVGIDEHLKCVNCGWYGRTDMKKPGRPRKVVIEEEIVDKPYKEIYLATIEEFRAKSIEYRKQSHDLRVQADFYRDAAVMLESKLA